MMILISLINLVSVMFVSLNNPVSLVILIIFNALNLCIMTTLISSTSWFSYILFLIFLGGLMVLFVYMCSVASNEQVSFKMSLVSLFIFLLSTLVMYLFMSFNKIKSINHLFLLESMFMGQNSAFILTAIIFLLLTLFVCVFMSKMKFGPVRSKKL